MQAEQLLCWSDMTDTEHSITSSSNEEKDRTREDMEKARWRRRGKRIKGEDDADRDL